MKRTYVPNVLTRHNSDSQGINLHKSRERLLQKEENKTSMQYLDLESATPWHLSQWKKRPSSPTSSSHQETRILSPSLNKLRKRVSITISNDPLLPSVPTQQDNESLPENKDENKSEILQCHSLPDSNSNLQQRQRTDESRFVDSETGETFRQQWNLSSCSEPTTLQTNTVENYQQEVSPQRQCHLSLRNLWQTKECTLPNSTFVENEEAFKAIFPEMDHFLEPWLSLENENADQDELSLFWTDFF